MIRAIIFDWGRTLHDPETDAFFPETAPIITRIARVYRLAIVSLITRGDYESQEARRRALLREAGLIEHFATVLFAPDHKDRLYEQALMDLGLRAPDVAIVDDRVEAGVRWGNRHGAPTIWLRSGQYADEAPTRETGTPTHTIDRLTDLETLLPL